MTSNESFSEFKINKTESSDSSSNSEEIKKYVIEFKKEIEKKFKDSSSNNLYKFPRKTNKIQKTFKIYDSLSKVSFYDLESQNVKKYISNLKKSKKNTNSSILMKTVKKLGSLDGRYLQSQLKDTRSEFFKILYKNVVRMKKSENKKNRKKINKTTILFPNTNEIKSLRKKNSNSLFFKVQKTSSNSKSKLAPILGYLNLKEKKTVKKKKRKTSRFAKKIKSLEQKNYITRKNCDCKKKAKNKSFKNLKKTRFSIKKPKTSRSHRYLKNKKLHQTKLKLAEYFKFEENKENKKKQNFDLAKNLNFILPVNKSDLKSLIKKKLSDKKMKNKKNNRLCKNKLTLKKFQSKIASIYSEKNCSKEKLNSCRVG